MTVYLEFRGIIFSIILLCRTTSEQINNEINALDARIKKIKKQIDLATTEDDIKEQMTEFLQVSQFRLLHGKGQLVLLTNERYIYVSLLQLPRKLVCNSSFSNLKTQKRY